MINEYRDWEQWDRQGTCQIIDAYWLSSQEEKDHRRSLAVLIKQQILPNGQFLEVGCGSGLIYKQLVPAIMPNSSYTGIDISETMLEIARKRFKKGEFLKDDLYSLSFPDNSFDTVAAFEVFGHIGDIEKPIQEMFRTTSRLMIFTVWTALETQISHEIIGNSIFLHKIFSREDILKTIEKALIGRHYITSEQPLSKGITAYIIHKKSH